MNSIYGVWWRFLMDLRPTVRFLGERFPRYAPWAVRLRSLLHIMVGNPAQVLAILDGLLLWRLFGVAWKPAVVGVVFVCLVLEVHHHTGYRTGSFLIGWREAWRFRRRFPSDWATVAAKTIRVQAEVGTSKEPIASAILRPVADHPKLSWWPRLEWPVVSWWVGPPPGRSLGSLDDVTVALAANVSHVSDVAVEYEREMDSHGRLIVSFHDVLAEPSTPPWSTNPDPGPEFGGPVEVDPFDALVEQLDQIPDPPTRKPRHLTVVDPNKGIRQ